MSDFAIENSKKSEWGRSLFTLMFLVIVTTGAMVSVQPPQRDNVAGGGFSNDTAMQHLKVIAREPRPVGSMANRIVRDYLVQYFKGLGFELDEQEGIYTYTFETRNVSLRFSNILARLHGTGDGTAILLMAHYDTVPNSPGAGDDGAAVAALLEVARVLKSEPRMLNDIIFLLTDCEEYGLLGARTFVREHPWFNDISLVLNFEGRGSSGPSIMFQTSPGNSRLIEHFAEAAVCPVTSSLAYKVFSVMSTSSDFAIFRNAGVAGFDFAFLGSPQNYHANTDNIANIDPRSLRHHGVQALVLARYFGNLILEENLQQDEDVVFFSLPWLGVVFYSNTWAFALALFTTIVFIAAIYYGHKKREITLRGISYTFATGLLNVITVSGATFLVWKLIPSDAAQGHPDLVFSGIVFLALGITSAYVCLLTRRLGVTNTAIGILSYWSILSVASAVWVPAASYIFVWPLLFSTISIVWLMYSTNPKKSPILLFVVQHVCAIPGIILIAPTARQAYLAVGLQGGYVLNLSIVLLLWTLIPHLQTLATPSRWLLPITAILAAKSSLLYVYLSN